MSTLLQAGDVIRIETGMAIYADIPAKFVYGNVDENHPNADTLVRHNVRVGSVLKTVNGTESFDTNVLAGEYLVEEARMGGGSRGGPGDPQHFPDGWKVILRSLDGGRYDPNGTRVSFFQSGAFSAVNENVPVLRHLERRVEFVEPEEDASPSFGR